MASILSRTAYRLSQSARVAWFGGHHILANRLGRRTAFAEKKVEVENEYPNRDRFLGEMRALFERDWANIEDPGSRAETFVACHLLKAVEG